MSTSESVLVPNRMCGWRMGLANMLAKEVAAWWRTRRWWVQCLVALLLLNGTLALNLNNDQGPASAGANFLIIAALAAPIAAISLAQDSILGERHSGTAAWVLSKPMRRPAFILSKLAAHGLGLLVAWIVLPGALAYIQLRPAIGHGLSGIGFVAALGLDYLNLLFYLTLAMMLSTLFKGRGAVLGIAILVDLTGLMQFIALPVQKYAPWLDSIMPWRLMIDFGRAGPLAGYLAMGQPLPTFVPIVATAVWCVLFVSVAIWRFRHEEF
jgi:ABC-type transport system involved in multi-copper enzyme maturation permease subunit